MTRGGSLFRVDPAHIDSGMMWGGSPKLFPHIPDTLERPEPVVGMAGGINAGLMGRCKSCGAPIAPAHASRGKPVWTGSSAYVGGDGGALPLLVLSALAFAGVAFFL